MKNSKKILVLAIVGCLCLLTLSSCNSRLEEQAGIYISSIQNVINNYIEYNEIMNGDHSAPTRENALATPANFTIQDGTYSFDKVENASYYVISVYEEKGSLDAVGSLTIQDDGSATYTGSMADIESASQGGNQMGGNQIGGDQQQGAEAAKLEYSYGEWYVRVVAWPEEGGTLEYSDAAFATYAVKGEVANGTISNKYVWNVCTGNLTVTLSGFDYAKTAYPTNVKVTLTNNSTQEKITVDTGKLTSSSVEVATSPPVSDADYTVSLDCEWDENFVTNPTWSTTAGEIAVSADKSLMSDGLSYTSGIFNQFEFPFVYEGFNPAAVSTDKAYAEIALEDGVVFGTSNAGNNECTFRAYPIWSDKGYEGKDGAIYSFDVRIKGASAITATPEKSPGSASTNIIFGQLDFFADGTFELEIEYQYIRTDAMNAGVYSVPGSLCEGFYHVEDDGSYTLSFDYANAHETAYEAVEELTGRASYYSEVDSEWSASSGNQGGGGFPGGGGGMPGGGNMSITPTTTPDFAAGAESIAVGINFMNNDSNLTGALKATATEGSTYSYALSGVGGMGEAITGTLELKADGSAVLFVAGFGPFGDCNATGTWTDADGTISVAFG